jgi:hypothetical protein
MLIFQALKLDADVTQRPTREFMAHTLGMLGFAYSVQEADRERFPTLEEFMRAWAEQGRGTRALGSDTVYVDFAPAPGFTHVSSSIRADDTVGTDCVRYESEFEERGNRNVPRGWVLAMHVNGIACRHPDDPGLLIDIAFSERMRKGAPNPDPAASERLLAQAQATLQSLRFERLETPAAP